MMQYSDIESYPDDHFRRYWNGILADPAFRKALARAVQVRLHTQPLQPRLFGGLARFVRQNVVYSKMLAKLRSVRSAVDFHGMMLKLVTLLIEHTTEGLSVSGVAGVADLKQRGACFMSNHRSTSLDPALVNYVLRTNFGKPVFNAAGDNIFKTRWLGHLIRLNRGFIVRRNPEGIDEKLLEAQKLSGYINKLVSRQEWVWIAHRNGRAKGGDDKTDSAVLAMLKMSGDAADWADFAEQMPIVPTAISWEAIPLDTQMARELHAIDDTFVTSGSSADAADAASDGTTRAAGPRADQRRGPRNRPAGRGRRRQNRDHRDAANIMGEIMLKKKRVHIHFAPPVHGAKRTDLVRGIDAAIHQHTRLWPANWAAWCSETASDEPRPDFAAVAAVAGFDPAAAQWLFDRADQLYTDVAAEHGEAKAATVRATLLSMYAKPVHNALTYTDSWRTVVEATV